jgi:hypothetical protein
VCTTLLHFHHFPAAARLASALSSTLHRSSVAHERRASGALVKQLLTAGLPSCWPDDTCRRRYSLPRVAACPVKLWRRWARRARPGRAHRRHPGVSGALHKAAHTHQCRRLEPQKARHRCWYCVKPGTTQCARRLNFLAHQHNRRCCWCQRLQAYRRTPTLFADVIVRDRVPECNAVALHSLMPSWTRRALLLLWQGVNCRPAGARRRSATCFCVPPRFTYHARPRRAADGSAGHGGGAAVLVQCFWCALFSRRQRLDARRPSRTHSRAIFEPFTRSNVV